jgi:predicted RNase H-like HicB family nuclease
MTGANNQFRLGCKLVFSPGRLAPVPARGAFSAILDYFGERTFKLFLNGGLKQTASPSTYHHIDMKLSVTVDRDEDGMWVVECPAIPGCVSQGETKANALKNIKEATAVCLEVRAERGLPLTVETCQVEVASRAQTQTKPRN